MSAGDFDRILDRTGSLSVKWDKRAISRICNNPDAIPHWVADMDFAVPPSVADALRAQADHAVLGYPHFDSLRETFIAWTAKRHRWKVDVSSVVITPGLLTSLALMIEMLGQKGDGIILPLPAYKPFVDIIENLERTPVPLHMPYDAASARFSLDPDELERLMAKPENRMLLFCSPHNPTGIVFTERELDDIARLSARYGVIVLSDEIHADLTFPGINHIPFDVAARRHGAVCATCMAPSKTFNIAGEHYSVVVCTDDNVRTHLIHRLRTLHMGADLLAATTAAAAYNGGYEWLMELNEYLMRQALHIENRLAQSGTGLEFVTPRASFIGMIDCRNIFDRVAADARSHPELYDNSRSPDGGLLSRFFGQRAAVAMNDGTWFGDRYGQFVRFNYGTPRVRVDEALDRIIAAVRNLP